MFDDLQEARKLSKAKKQPGSLLSRQREKLTQQRLDAANAKQRKIEQYEREKAAREARGETGARYGRSERITGPTLPRSVHEESKRVAEVLKIVRKNAKKVEDPQVTRKQQETIQAQTQQQIRNVVAEYLIQNELCETQESAFAICEAMSDEWMREIVEGKKRDAMIQQAIDLGRQQATPVIVDMGDVGEPGSPERAAAVERLMRRHTGASKVKEEQKRRIKSAKEAMKSVTESEVSKPQERLVTDRQMFTIPPEEQEAARQRALAKAKAMREKNKNK